MAESQKEKDKMTKLYKTLIPWRIRVRIPALIKAAVLIAPFAMFPIAVLGGM